MKSIRFTVTVLGLLAMTACITETTGRIQTAEQPKVAADLNVQLGIGYLRQGDWQSARVKLERAVEQDPDNVVANRALGLVYEKLGDIEGAERHYRRSVSLDPKDPDALNSLAVFLCGDEGKRDEALDLFDRALSIPLSTAYSNKAMLYTNAGVCMKGLDLERSEDYLRAALAVDPQFGDALLQLADVSYQRGNYLQSRAFLQRHLVVAGPSPGALWLGVRIENAMDDFQAADQFGNQLRLTFPESLETRQLLEQLRDTG
jgi:type IV pilus assembly protein PilF